LERPSIKGTAFVSAVTDLQEMMESGRLSREQLELRLRPEDVEILDSKILPGDWYPIDSYGRVIDLLGEVDGGGEAYHIRRGRRAAERLLKSGIYRQLDRAVEQRAEKDRASLIGIMLTVGRTLYNFGSWEILREQSSDRVLRFELRQMAALPENARITIQGFVDWAAEHILECRTRVESRRAHPERILFDIHIG
jgi:hypothetical protein